MNPYPKTHTKTEVKNAKLVTKMGQHKIALTHEEVYKIQRERRKAQQTKVIFVKRTPIKPVSKKQAKENAELKKLTDKLRELCKEIRYYMVVGYYKSELSGKLTMDIEPHHLAGRGKNLCNPFTICMLSRAEHLVEQKHMGYEHKQELINKIRPIRLAQGFREEDYK